MVEEQVDLFNGFSILERIVGIETGPKCLVVPRSLSSFSILERIVGIETHVEIVGKAIERSFQYPRTDRWH